MSYLPKQKIKDKFGLLQDSFSNAERHKIEQFNFVNLGQFTTVRKQPTPQNHDCERLFCDRTFAFNVYAQLLQLIYVSATVSMTNCPATSVGCFKFDDMMEIKFVSKKAKLKLQV